MTVPATPDTSPPGAPTFGDAFAGVLTEVMAWTRNEINADDETDSGDDDGQSALFLMRNTSDFFIFLYPVDSEAPLAVTRAVAMEKELPEGMSDSERHEHMYYLGQRDTRAETLLLAAMFSDSDERILLMPTIANLKSLGT
jgi:hypothetical protein